MATKKIATLDDILKKKKARTIEFPIVSDPELADQRDKARQTVEEYESKAAGRARMVDRAVKEAAAEGHVAALRAGLADVEAELEAARVELAATDRKCEAATVTFVFGAVGRKVLETILRVHKPTSSQIAEIQAEQKANGQTLSGLDFNPETFPAALLAAASVSPKMTVEEADELWDSDVFSQGELRLMFQAAWGVNNVVSQ